MKIKSLIILFILSFILIISISSINAYDKYAGAFLNNGSSARAISLGKTGFINNFDASSLYWNPALLNNLTGRNLSLMLSQPFEEVNDLQYHTLFFSSDMWNGKVGIGILYETAGDMIKTDNSGTVSGTFDAKEIALLAGYSKKLNEFFTGGINLKIVNQKIESYSGSGFGADLGMQYKPQNNLSFGLSLKNLIPPQVKMNREKETYPLRIELGGNYNFLNNFGIYYGFSLESSELSHHTGMEYSFQEILDLRLGYDEETESFTGGLGFKFTSVQLDYSYKDHTTLGGTHIFSLNVVNF